MAPVDVERIVQIFLSTDVEVLLGSRTGIGKDWKKTGVAADGRHAAVSRLRSSVRVASRRHERQKLPVNHRSSTAIPVPQPVCRVRAKCPVFHSSTWYAGTDGSSSSSSSSSRCVPSLQVRIRYYSGHMTPEALQPVLFVQLVLSSQDQPGLARSRWPSGSTRAPVALAVDEFDSV